MFAWLSMWLSTTTLYTLHAFGLMVVYGLTVVWIPDSPVAWLTGRKVVHAPPIIGPESYAVVLHEIGHAARPVESNGVYAAYDRGCFDTPEQRTWIMFSQSRASMWAIDNAIDAASRQKAFQIFVDGIEAYRYTPVCKQSVQTGSRTATLKP